MLVGAAAAVTLVVVGVVVGVMLTRGSSSSTTDTTSIAHLPGAGDVQQLLKEVPQSGNVLGSPSSPVTMVEYVDLQCPYCAQFETESMPTLIRRYVRAGKLKVEARIIAFLGADSSTGRDAAIAAGEQNKLFNYMQLLYSNQGGENTGWLNDDTVKAAAASVPGLDVAQLLDARNSSAVSDRASAFDTEKSDDHVNSTPTILVGKTGETLAKVELPSPTDLQPVTRAIDAALP